MVFSSVLFLNSGLAASPGSRPLSIEEKAGQLLVIGIEGSDFTPQTARLMGDIRPGGVLLFQKNISSRSALRELNDKLQASSAHPLFIAVDQEGGVVSRVKTTPPLPSARWLGRFRNVSLTKEVGFSVGQVLRSLGINMNFAPVLDVANSDQKSFLRSRSYSTRPEVVADLGSAFSQGLIAAGVVPTAKHFPGLGAAVGDPHTSQVIQASSIRQMHKTHLMPFKKFSELFPSAMMLSHATYPSLDNGGSATFSSKISTSLLRKGVGFRGLIITDDLMMAGAKTERPLEERVVSALKSGADILLFAWSSKTQRRAHQAIVSAIKSGQLPVALVDEKLRRIGAIKNWIAENNKVRVFASDPESELKNVLTKLRLSDSRRR